MRKSVKLPQGQVTEECQQNGTISHMKKGGKEVDGNPGAYKSSLGGQWRSERGIVRGRQKANVARTGVAGERALYWEDVHRAAVAEKVKLNYNNTAQGRQGFSHRLSLPPTCCPEGGRPSISSSGEEPEATGQSHKSAELL